MAKFLLHSLVSDVPNGISKVYPSFAEFFFRFLTVEASERKQGKDAMPDCQGQSVTVSRCNVCHAMVRQSTDLYTIRYDIY